MKKKESKDPDSKLVEVKKVWGVAEAEVIKSYLENNGIPCLYRGQVVQSIHPFTADGLGEIKILVFEKDLKLARKLLKENAGR
ncbi:MAG: putative signal transducing protein [Candidatus Aminicenantales bacterium]